MIRKKSKVGGKKLRSFKVVIERDKAGFFVGNVPELEGCFTQAKTMKDLKKRLREVIALCLEDTSPVKKEVRIEEIKVPIIQHKPINNHRKVLTV